MNLDDLQEKLFHGHIAGFFNAGMARVGGKPVVDLAFRAVSGGILQNCMIFNNGIHNYITNKEVRADRTIHLVHGEKMVFGKDMDKGIVQDGFGLKAVTIGQDGYTIDDVLVHDAHCKSNFLHQQLAMMDGHELPLAIGVIRDVDSLSYEAEVQKQVEEVQVKHGFSCLRDMILSGDNTWEVK